MSPARRVAVLSRRYWRRPTPTLVRHLYDGDTGVALCGKPEPRLRADQTAPLCAMCNQAYHYYTKRG